MDFPIVFKKKVLEKYKIKTILTPKNRGEGELENVILSDLRKALNRIYTDIDSFILKEQLLDYLEDYIITLTLISVPSKKAESKRIRKKITKLRNQYPNLNVEIKEDEKILEEINELEWKFSQENFILTYLKEQRHFIRNWIFNKRLDLEQEFTSQSSKNRTISIPKEPHFYCKIGALFAQNLIVKKTTDNMNYNYFYKEHKFSTINTLSKHVKVEVLNTKHSVRQYINDTLLDSDSQKNFYNSPTMLKKIIEYCEQKNIDIINPKIILK